MGINRRWLVGLCAVLSFLGRDLAAQTVAADATALVRQGDRLAKQKRYNDALIAFKSADRLYSRAEHDCWIGLVYARLNQVTQANYFVSRCKARAGRKRPIPWYPKAKRLVAQMRKAGKYSLVTVTVKQRGAKIRPTMFDSDEWLKSPAKLWLPMGRHGLDAKAKGFGAKRAFVDVLNTKSKKVRIDLGKGVGSAGRPQLQFPALRKARAAKTIVPASPTLGARTTKPQDSKEARTAPGSAPPAASDSAPPPIVPLSASTASGPTVKADAPPAVDLGAPVLQSQSSSILPTIAWTALGVGALSLGASAYFYTLGDAAARAADASTDKPVRNAELQNYSSYSVVTYSAYGVGGAMLGIGAGLLLFDALTGPDAPKAQVAIAPTLDGGQVQWSGRF